MRSVCRRSASPNCGATGPVAVRPRACVLGDAGFGYRYAPRRSTITPLVLIRLPFVPTWLSFGELEVEKMKRCFLLVAMFVLLSGMTVLAQAAGEDKSKEWPYGPYDKLHGNRVEFYATADETNAASKYIAGIKELLPQNWEVKGVTNNAVPYNLGIKPDQPRGTRIELVGPSVVKGPRG